MTAKRLSDAEAKAVLDFNADFDRRFKEQKPAAGSEAAVRRMVEGFIAGKPDYDLMSPTRQQLPGLQSTFAGFGVLQSVTFKGVGPGGADIYQVKFEKSSIDYRSGLRRMEKSTARTSVPSNSAVGQKTRAETLRHSPVGCLTNATARREIAGFRA